MAKGPRGEKRPTDAEQRPKIAKKAAAKRWKKKR